MDHFQSTGLASTHLRKNNDSVMPQIHWRDVQRGLLHEHKVLWPLEFSCEEVWMGAAVCSLLEWHGS